MRFNQFLASSWVISVLSIERTDAFRTFAPNVFSKRITITKVMMADSIDPQTMSSTPRDTTVKKTFGSWSEKEILASSIAEAPPQAEVSSIFTENRPIEKLDDSANAAEVVNEFNQSESGEFSDMTSSQYGKAMNDAELKIPTESETSFGNKEPIEFAIDDKDIRRAESSSPKTLANEPKITTNYTKEYAAWCREFGKVPDEHRFQVFSTNYELMGTYCKENGVEMDLTEFADLTEDEYYELMAKEEPKRDMIAVTEEEEDVQELKDVNDGVSKENSAVSVTSDMDNLEEIEALQADNSALSKEIAELEEQVESFDDESSKGKPDQQQVPLSEKEASTDLQNQLSKMKEEKDTVINELQKELADVKKSKTEVETTYTSLISSLKSSKENLVKKYETMLQSKNDKINALEEKVSERDNIIDRMKNEMKKLQSFIKKLTSGKDNANNSDSEKNDKMTTNQVFEDSKRERNNDTRSLSMANTDDTSNSNVSKKTLRNRRRRQNKRRRMREKKKNKNDDDDDNDDEHKTNNEMKEKIKNAYVKMSKLYA